MLNSKGFTLIELMVVIFILSAIAIGSLVFGIGSSDVLEEAKTISVSFTIKGDSDINIVYTDEYENDQHIEYDINGTRSFECDIPADTGVTFKWKSNNDEEVEVMIDYNQTEKTMSGKEGEWEFKTPCISTECFIETSRLPWF